MGCFDCIINRNNFSENTSNYSSTSLEREKYIQMAKTRIIPPKRVYIEEQEVCTHVWEAINNEKHACDKCGVIEDHKWNNAGKCTVCNRVCSHDWNTYTGKCEICGMSKPTPSQNKPEIKINNTTISGLYKIIEITVSGGSGRYTKVTYQMSPNNLANWGGVSSTNATSMGNNKYGITTTKNVYTKITVTDSNNNSNSIVVNP